MNNNWKVYLLRCSDNSLYCGVTNNMRRRLRRHLIGRGSKYTRSRLPVELVWESTDTDKSTALKAEYYIKKRTKADKEELLTGCGVLHQALLESFGMSHRNVTIN